MSEPKTTTADCNCRNEGYCPRHNIFQYQLTPKIPSPMDEFRCVFGRSPETLPNDSSPRNQETPDVNPAH